MSWTTIPVSVSGSLPVTGLDALVATGQGGPEVDRALEAAKNAAADLIRSGAVGGPYESYRVQAFGHVNPNNEPVAGWSNDTITINVSQE